MAQSLPSNAVLSKPPGQRASPLIWPGLPIAAGVAGAMTFVWLAFSKPPFSVMVDVSVALGTGLLGAAAFYQTLSENQKRATDETNRHADRAPHLRIMTEKHASSRMVYDPNWATTKKPKTAKFESLEVFAENVGPGIAGKLEATLVCMYFDIEYELPGESEADEEEAYLMPLETIAKGPKFSKRALRLASEYLPVGVENRLLLFDADEEGSWEYNENSQDPRAFLVLLRNTDLDGYPAEATVGAVWWIAPTPKGWGLDESEYETTSRWHRALPDVEAAIVEAWNAWERRTASPPAQLAPKS
jgi:hypothetical protein